MDMCMATNNNNVIHDTLQLGDLLMLFSVSPQQINGHYRTAYQSTSQAMRQNSRSRRSRRNECKHISVLFCCCCCLIFESMTTNDNNKRTQPPNEQIRYDLPVTCGLCQKTVISRRQRTASRRAVAAKPGLIPDVEFPARLFCARVVMKLTFLLFDALL